MSRWQRFLLTLDAFLEPFRLLKHRRERLEAREEATERRLMQFTENLVNALTTATVAQQAPLNAAALALQTQATGFAAWMEMISAAQGDPRVFSNSDANEAARERATIQDLIDKGYPVESSAELQLRYLIASEQEVSA